MYFVNPDLTPVCSNSLLLLWNKIKIIQKNENITAVHNDLQSVEEECDPGMWHRQVYLEDEKTKVLQPRGFYSTTAEKPVAALKGVFTINTKSILGSVLRFHSCVDASSKNVKHAVLLCFGSQWRT